MVLFYACNVLVSVALLVLLYTDVQVSNLWDVAADGDAAGGAIARGEEERREQVGNEIKVA